jgi:hypothetical protein
LRRGKEGTRSFGRIGGSAGSRIQSRLNDFFFFAENEIPKVNIIDAYERKYLFYVVKYRIVLKILVIF